MSTKSNTTTAIWMVPLLLLQVVISAAGLTVEIVAGRMIAPYVGMSLYTWTSIIAVVLAGFSIGHWWGGRLAAWESHKALCWTGWIMFAAAATTGLASLVLRATVGPVLDAIGDPIASIFMVTVLAFFLPSLFAGVPAPVLAVVAMRKSKTSERALGSMFAAGSIGAIAGTLLSGFVFISWLGSIKTLLAVSALYILSAVVCFALARTVWKDALKALAILAIIIIGWQALALPKVCAVESSYFCIRTVKLSSAPDAPVNLMVIDHLAHGVNARNEPLVMQTDHTAMLDALPRMRTNERDFSSFHIGGGSYSLPRAWSARGHSDITVAEIDSAVTAHAIQDFWFDPKRMTIIHHDGRRALTATARQFDVIVGDAFTDITVPAHLVTREFFQLVKSRLTKNGVYAMNVVDDAESLRALTAIYTTLHSVFPTVEVWTEATDPVPGERRVFVLLAAQDLSPQSQIRVRTPAWKQFAALDAGFIDSVVTRNRAEVLTDDFAPIDRLMGFQDSID